MPGNGHGGFGGRQRGKEPVPRALAALPTLRDLTPEQRGSLASLSKTNSGLYRAYLLKEQLRLVFSTKGETRVPALSVCRVLTWGDVSATRRWSMVFGVGVAPAVDLAGQFQLWRRFRQMAARSAAARRTHRNGHRGVLVTIVCR